MYTHFIYLGWFRAFHREWYSNFVEGLVETSRFVNSLWVFRLDWVWSLWQLPQIFSFSYLHHSLYKVHKTKFCLQTKHTRTYCTNSNTWLYYFHPIMYEVTHKIPILIILKSKFCWRDSILRQQKQLTIYLYMYQLIF